MQILGKIGDGLSSVINKCIINHKQYALKSFKECSHKLREREIKIINSLKHNKIISILEFDQDYNWYTTPLTKTDLLQLIITQNYRMHYNMHSIDQVHKDIKLENIMLNSEAKLFIIDFGLSVCLHTSKQYPRHCSTATYMAPELNQDEKSINANSLKKIDVVALGVVIFILAYVLLLQLPFNLNVDFGTSLFKINGNSFGIILINQQHNNIRKIKKINFSK